LPIEGVEYSERIEKILAHDGSEGAKKALTAAITLAKKFGAELQSVSVKERPPLCEGGG